MDNSKSFAYASLAMSILEKLLRTRFTVSGLEKIPNQPVMFVANHFTRSETFFVPYIINKCSQRHVRCLADAKLFHGIFGKFLQSVGTVSTKDPNRDNIILEDLISSSFDWMIYPEGSMVKSKEIKFDRLYVSYTPYRIGPVRTGASVLALKSQLYRDDLIMAHKTQNRDILNDYKRDYGIEYNPKLDNLQTHIVPVNITYYPIRPGDNKIKSLANRLIKNLPKQILEELEIEGNILLGSNIDINFGDPINLADYIKSTQNLINRIPIIKYETKNNFVIKYYRSKLTSDFMKKVYNDIQINFDHLFVATLKHLAIETITINYLKRIIYYSAVLIAKTKKYRLNYSVFESNIFNIFSDEKNQEFDSVFQLALNQSLISKISPTEILINKNQLCKKYDFHEIRIENTLQVISREFDLIDGANSIVKKVCSIDHQELRNLVFKNIFENDVKIFEQEYQNVFDKEHSKSQDIGRPFYIDKKVSCTKNIQNFGVVLAHGYKSSPQEFVHLANFLGGFGIKTYVVRLRGHGTAPSDIKNFIWMDWYNSLQRGYCALANICSNVAIIGFSMGGLLSLLSASQKNSTSKLVGVVSINSALKLRDIKVKMVAGIILWNQLVDKFNLEKGRLEFVDDIPENPHINYSRNYLKGVYELEKLMILCEDNLHKINVPTLIIQANNDPVVNPKSGELIYKKINSEVKKLVEFDADNHVIITSPNRDLVFQEIMNFFNHQKIV